ARRVDHAEPDAATELEDVAVAKGRRIGTRREVELLDDDAPPRAIDGGVEAVDRHQAVERADAGHVGLVQVPRHVGKSAVSGDGTLVAVPVRPRCAPRRVEAALRGGNRGIDAEGLVAPGDEQRIALRVLSAPLADEDGRMTEIHPSTAGTDA